MVDNINVLLVANSFTGELFPVDKFVVNLTISKKLLIDEDLGNLLPSWTERNQTIYDLMMAGF